MPRQHRSVEQLAADLGIDLNDVQSTSTTGYLSENDVLNHAAANGISTSGLTRNNDDFIDRQLAAKGKSRKNSGFQIKPGPNYNTPKQFTQQPMQIQRGNNVGPQRSDNSMRQPINNQPPMSFSGNVPGGKRPEYDDLISRLSGTNLNPHLVDTDLGQAVSLTQLINNEKVDTHVLFGPSGGTYLSNPKNQNSLRVMSTLGGINKQNNQIEWTSPLDRIVGMAKSPNGRSILSNAQRQGAVSLPIQQLASQPGLDVLNAHSFQIAMGDKNQADDIIAQVNSSGKWQHGELARFNGTSTAFVTNDYRSVMANDGSNLVISKLKRLKNMVGRVDTLGRGVGNQMEQGQEPFYFEGQQGPNRAYNVREARDVFGMMPEGSSYQSNLYASKIIKRQVTLPQGSSYDPETKQVTMNDGTVVAPQTYYGRKIGRMSDQYTRAGGRNLFHQIFGFSVNSYSNFQLDKAEPIFDQQGNFSGKMNIEGLGTTPDLAMKYAGKEEPMRVRPGVMPKDDNRKRADIWGMFPDEKELPSFALQVLKAESQTTEGFQNIFGDYARGQGKSQDWIDQHTAGGHISSEAAPMVMQMAIQRVTSRLKPIQQQNVTISQMQYEATKDATFTHEGVDYNVIPNTPGNVTQNPSGTYTIGTRNDLRGFFNTARNFRVENTREQSNLKPGALEAMAEYNPELFGSMMSIAKAQLPNNKAYNQVASYRANYSDEQRQAVQNTFGIQKVDYNKVLGYGQSLLSQNPSASPDDIVRGTLAGLKKDYGNSSLEVQTPQGSMVLPNAGSISSSLTEDQDTRTLLPNWATSAAHLITQSTQVQSNAASGVDDPDAVGNLQDLASQTYSQLGKHVNTEGVLQKAMGLSFERLGGFAMGANELGANETVASLKHISRITGIQDPKQLREMAQSGELNLNALRYPFSDPEDQFVGTKMRFFEDMPKEFQDKYNDPGKNFYMSPEIAAMVHGDFDGDRIIGMMNRVNGVGGTTSTVSPGQVVGRAKNKFESEYTKQLENYQKRSGFNTAKAFGGALFKTATSDLGKMFRAEEGGAKRNIGPVYNAIFRGFGGAVNASTEKMYGAEDPVTRRMASAVGDINSYATQSLVDTDNNRDEALESVIGTARSVQRRKNGSYFIGKNSQVAGSSEEFYGKMFRAMTRVGGNLKGEGFGGDSNAEYSSKLAPAIATSLMSRDEMQSLQQSGGLQSRIDQMSDLLTHQRSSGADMTDEIMSMTGNEGGNFTSWGQGKTGKGLSSLSGAAQWISGRVVSNFFNKGFWDESTRSYKRDPNTGKKLIVGQYPEWGQTLREAGEQAVATQGFQFAADHPTEGVEGVVSNRGGMRGLVSHIQSLFPAGGNPQEAADRFSARAQSTTSVASGTPGDLYNSSDHLIASSWTYGSGKDDELLRLVRLNTRNNQERSAVMDELHKSGAFQEWSPFTGPQNNSADVGKRMEDVLTPELSVKGNSQVLMGNRKRGIQGSLADLMLRDQSGNLVAADIKTKTREGITSDLLGPQVRGDIMGQISSYITGTRMDNGEKQSKSQGVILGGIRLGNDPNMNPDLALAGFAAAHDQMMSHFLQEKAPQGWDQSQWDKTRQSSIDMMNYIENTTGLQVGARVVSGDEANAFLDSRQGNALDLKSLNPSYRSKNAGELSQQILALKNGGNVPHVPTTQQQINSGGSSQPPFHGSAGNGGSGGSGGVPTAFSAPDPGSGSIPFNNGGGSSGGSGVINNNVFKTSVPSISDKAIFEASQAFDHLTDAAHVFASGSKEAREEMLKHYDALKKVSTYMSGIEDGQRKGTLDANTLSNNPAYQEFQKRLGSGRPGGSAVSDIINGVSNLSDAAWNARVANANDTGEAPSLFDRIKGGVEGIAERAIKGQGLFHAKLALNAIVSPVVNEAKQYQNYQSNIAEGLYQNGNINYDQLMSGTFGVTARREATFEQARLAFGQQALSAYSPLINAAISPDITNGPLGAAAGIGLPALGAGIAASSLLGSPLAGGVVAAGAAAVGIAGYLDSSANPKDIRSREALGKQVATNNGPFQGQVGQFTNQHSIIQSAQIMAYQLSGGAIGTSAKDINGTVAPGPVNNQSSSDLYNATQSYLAGKMTLKDLKKYYPNVNLADVASGAADQTIQNLGFSDGLQSAQGNALYGNWMAYHTTSPVGTSFDNLKQLAVAGQDSTGLALSMAGAQNISPFNRPGVANLQDQAAARLVAAQNAGANIGQANAQYSQFNQDITPANQLAYMARTPGISSTDTMLQGLQVSSPAIYNSILGGMTQGKQLQLSNPTYAKAIANNYLDENGKANFAYDQGNFVGGNTMTQQVVQGSDLFNQALNMGVNPATAIKNVQQTITADPRQAAMYNSILSGNRAQISVMAQHQGNYQYQTMNTDTGMDAYYQNVSQGSIAQLRTNDPYNMFRLTDQQAQMGTYGYQNQVLQDQRQQQNAGFVANNQSRDINYMMQAGSLQQAQQIAGQGNPYTGFAGTQLNIGNGMNYYQVQDAQRNLQRAQSNFGVQQEGQQLGIAQQQFGLNQQQFTANFGLQTQEFQASTNYNRNQMNIQQGQTVQQEGWQTQDLAYNRSQLDINFAWQMQDDDRNIRYARGMDKRNLMRDKSRQIIEYSMQAGHSDTEQSRNQTQIQWEEQNFDRQKQYFEQTTQFQQTSLDNQKKFFDAGQELDRQRLQMQQDAHNKNVQWLTQQYQLEDQQRTLDRTSATWQYQNSVAMDTKTQALTKDTQIYQDALQHVSDVYTQQNSLIDIMVQKASILSGVLNQSSGSQPVGIGSTVGGSLGTGGTGGSTITYGSGTPLNAQPVYGSGVYGTGLGQLHGFATGGYTGTGGVTDPAGIVHKGEYVVPQEGAMVVRGQDPESSKKQDRMIQLLEKISENPAMFQAVVNGVPTKAQPVYQQAKARL